MIIGLTGGICTGKSNITKILLSTDMAIVDADKVARDVVVVNSAGYNKIIDAFGEKYLNSDNTINRTKLGELVFSSKEHMDKLNSIMQPLIINESWRQINNFKKLGHKYIVFDCALIIEMGLKDDFRPLIVATCPKDMQLERLMKRNSFTEEHALNRINSQLSSDERVKYADFIIDTSGTIEQTIIRTKEVIKEIKNVL